MSQGGEICLFDGVWAFSSVPAIARPNAWCATCAGKQTANWALGRAGHKKLPREQKRSCRLMFRMVVSRCLTVYIPFISICSIFAYVCTPSSYSIWGQSRITLYSDSTATQYHPHCALADQHHLTTFQFGFGQLIPDIPIHSQLPLILPVIWYFHILWSILTPLSPFDARMCQASALPLKKVSCTLSSAASIGRMASANDIPWTSRQNKPKRQGMTGLEA